MIEYILMNESHAAQVASLENQCFSTPWSLQSIESEVHNPLALWIVALDGEKVTGYVGSQTVLGEADMMNLAVLPEYRGRGIGFCLVETLIKRLQENNVHCLTLEVRSSNDIAIKLYGRLGFSQVGNRRGYYLNPKEDALILRKEW